VNDLSRFTFAQDSPYDGYATALQEMQAGAKRGHWIWYIFPQLAGLGSSEASRQFAIRDAGEAAAYLRDPVLRRRYREITAAVADHLRRGVPLPLLMRSEIDARKLISSLTLFTRVADRLSRDEPGDAYRDIATLGGDILRLAERQGFEPCAFTAARLDRDSDGPP
jgi:uncharacterized protein (DUF1810 family)